MWIFQFEVATRKYLRTFLAKRTDKKEVQEGPHQGTGCH